MSQTVQIALISVIAGVVAASVIYALWGAAVTMIGRARARARAAAAVAATDSENDDQSAEQPE